MAEQRMEWGGGERVPLSVMFAGQTALADRMAEAVSIVGGRMDTTLGFEDFDDRLEIQGVMDTVIVAFGNDDGPRVTRVVRSLERVVQERGVPGLIAVPFPLLDATLDSLSGHDIELLCEPDRADCIAALANAVRPKSKLVSDSQADLDSIRLKRLADEVNRIARALSSLSVSGDHDGPYSRVEASGITPVRDMQIGFAAEPEALTAPVLPAAAEVRSMLRLRRLREQYFSAELFADPAWDMLLDLLAARIEGDQVAVSSLCIAAAVPPTTALRWIKTMTDAGLFERHADPMDGRRIFIRLTDTAAAGLSRYFLAARRFGAAII